MIVPYEPPSGGIKIVSCNLESWITFEHADRFDKKYRQITQVNCSTTLLDTGQNTLDRTDFIVHGCNGDHRCHGDRVWS